jgi:hypothetical protein
MYLRPQKHTQLGIVYKNVNNAFFIKNWECKVKAHDIVDKKKLKLIELTSQY